MKLALALVAALGATAARAEPSFDLFRKVCVDTRANEAAVKASPAIAGWAPWPEAAKGLADATRADAWVKPEGQTHKAVLQAHVTRMRKGIETPADACVVLAQGVDVAEARRVAKDFAGVPADPAWAEGPEYDAYAWTQSGGRRLPLKLEQLASTPHQTVTLFVFRGEGTTAFFGLMAPTP